MRGWREREWDVCWVQGSRESRDRGKESRRSSSDARGGCLVLKTPAPRCRTHCPRGSCWRCNWPGRSSLRPQCSRSAVVARTDRVQGWGDPEGPMSSRFLPFCLGARGCQRSLTRGGGWNGHQWHYCWCLRCRISWTSPARVPLEMAGLTCTLRDVAGVASSRLADKSPDDASGMRDKPELEAVG